MIRVIAAIDNQRGIAKDGHIPWDLPLDKARFRKLTLHYGANVLMGRKTYIQMGDYLLDKHSYIVSHQQLNLPAGSTLVNDLDSFLTSFNKDLWVIGGAKIYSSSLKYVHELYLTVIDKDFDCNQFFPEIEEFKLTRTDGPYFDNGLKFSYQLLIRF